MIDTMTKYSFILLNREQEGFLAQLQELGMVDITRSVKPVDGQSSALLAHAEEIERILSSLEGVEIPEGLVPAPVEGELETAARKLLEQLSDAKDALKAAEKDYSARAPWGAFSADELRKLAEAGCPVHFHVTASKSFRPEWAESNALQVVAEQDGKTYYVVAGDDPLPDGIAAPADDLREATERIDTLLYNTRTR